MRSSAPSPCEAPRPSHTSGTEPPPPRQAALSVGTAAVLDTMAAIPIQLSMNRQPDGPATDDVYGRIRQTVAFHPDEDKHDPAGLSRSLQNWEIIPKTRGVT